MLEVNLLLIDRGCGQSLRIVKYVKNEEER